MNHNESYSDSEITSLTESWQQARFQGNGQTYFFNLNIEPGTYAVNPWHLFSMGDRA